MNEQKGINRRNIRHTDIQFLCNQPSAELFQVGLGPQKTTFLRY